MFSIETSSGKLIRAHSYFESQNEILLPPGIHLQVTYSLNPTQGLYMIHLREIHPPFKMLADPFDLSQLKQDLPQPSPFMPSSREKEGTYVSTAVTSKPSFKNGKLLPNNSVKYISRFYCMFGLELLLSSKIHIMLSIL